MKIGKRWQFNFWNDYEFLNVRWIDYRIIGLDFERDYIANSVEFSIGLLGLHVMVTYWCGDHPETMGDTPVPQKEG